MPIRNALHRFCGAKSLRSEGETFRIAFHIGLLLGSCERMNPIRFLPQNLFFDDVQIFLAPSYLPPQEHAMLSCQVAIVLTIDIV